MTREARGESVRGDGHRQCAGCGEPVVSGSSVRWVIDPDSGLVPDWSGRTAGMGIRGAHTHVRVECVTRAASRGGFSRAFESNVRGEPSELVLRMVAAGRRGWFDRLGLALRAGKVQVGQASSREGLADAPGLVVLAGDAGEAGQRKFGFQADRKGVSVVRLASGGEMGRALGREFVSVLVISASSFADELRRRGEALSGLPGSGFEFMGTTEVGTSEGAPSRAVPRRATGAVVSQ